MLSFGFESHAPLFVRQRSAKLAASFVPVFPASTCFMYSVSSRLPANLGSQPTFQTLPWCENVDCARAIHALSVGHPFLSRLHKSTSIFACLTRSLASSLCKRWMR